MFDQAPLQRARMLAVLTAFAAAYFLTFLYRSVLAISADTLVHDFRLDAAALGLLGSAFFFANALSLLPVGIAIDRFGPRAVQLVILPIAAIGCFLFAAATSPIALIGGRLLIGIGVSAAFIAALKANTLCLGHSRRSMADGALIAAGALGSIAATTPAELFQTAFGWRALFVAMGIMALFCAAAIYWTAPAFVPTKRASVKHFPLRRIATDIAFWRLGAVSTCCIGTALAMNGLWAAVWLTDVAQLPRSGVVNYMLVMAIAFAATGTGLGIIVGPLTRRGVSAERLLLVFALMSIVAQLLLVLQVLCWPIIAWAVIGSSAGASVLTYAALLARYPRHMGGQVASVINILHIFGSFAIQSAIGAAIAYLIRFTPPHSTAIPYRAAFLLNIAVQLGALLWFFLSAFTEQPRRVSTISAEEFVEPYFQESKGSTSDAVPRTFEMETTP